MPPVNPMEELFPEYPRGTMASAVMPSGEAGPNATAHLWSATPSASLTATAAAVVNNQLNDVSLVEAPFAGPHGPAVPATFQPATVNIFEHVLVATSCYETLRAVFDAVVVRSPNFHLCPTRRKL